ncbi:hypothetical protein D3C87_894350 [compost metagenome]
MAISYYDFKNLPDVTKQELVIAEGKVVIETEKDKLKFVLYEISSFSVEIVYYTVNNKIASLSAFQNNGSYGR